MIGYPHLGAARLLHEPLRPRPGGARRVSEEIASILSAKWAAGLSGGAVVANPIPEEYSMDPAVIGPAIDTAVAEAAARGIGGKRLTPFLLARIVELTGGDSLESNIALVKNNATLAAGIAGAYAALGARGEPTTSASGPAPTADRQQKENAMKIARILHENKEVYAIVEGDCLRLAEGSPFAKLEPTAATIPLEGAKLLAPCVPGKALCVGLNYRDPPPSSATPSPRAPSSSSSRRAP